MLKSLKRNAVEVHEVPIDCERIMNELDRMCEDFYAHMELTSEGTRTAHQLAYAHALQIALQYRERITKLLMGGKQDENHVTKEL